MSRVGPRDVEHLSNRIKPLLAGKSPELQGAVLADLLALFIAGHHPGLREEILLLHIEAVRALVEPNEAMMFPDGLPPGWAAQ
jgi:hypothetical protein